MGRPMFILFAAICLLVAVSEAKEFIVGGTESTTFWKIPSSHRSNLNYWAEKQRFSKGDVLVWKSVAKKDSVLQVNKEAYESCNTTSDHTKRVDGELTLDRSGPFYFISGLQGHCKKGQKLEVVVLSDHHRNLPLAPAPAPETASGTCKVGALGSVVATAAVVSLLF
ncbi:Early nodulin-like protein 1 [Linum perenne]